MEIERKSFKCEYNFMQFDIRLCLELILINPHPIMITIISRCTV